WYSSPLPARRRAMTPSVFQLVCWMKPMPWPKSTASPRVPTSCISKPGRVPLFLDAHNGWDQLTLEARNYGLAKRYDPFQVNTVVGFIGPEYLYDARQIQRAGLEDHFMGKLTGIPMGCDACYTNHARADQNAIENLAVMLTAAGCNYFMGVPMGASWKEV